MIIRIALIAVLIIAVSALAKGLLFTTALAPDDSGRQRIEQQGTQGCESLSATPECRREEDNHAQ
ncbi:hypothetical protein [Marinobacter fonticola]|uniref:hypothetical protein n=1 Tax=Marinobacter fonticola TaxID=2603215 RepID=UPI0011E63842|nr:hypothetical protein [Marinobacter fonticola]